MVMATGGAAVEDTFEASHARAKELLGTKYDEQRVNGCMSFPPIPLEKMFEELEFDLHSAATEEEKDMVRTAWLDKYDLITAAANYVDEDTVQE